MNNRRRNWLLVGGLALVGVLFVAVFPARTYLDQHRQRQEVLARIKSTDARNRSLEQRIRTLHRDAGQPFIEVSPETNVDPQNGGVDVRFRITRQKVIQGSILAPSANAVGTEPALFEMINLHTERGSFFTEPEAVARNT